MDLDSDFFKSKEEGTFSAFYTLLDTVNNTKKALPELPILSNLRISYLDLIPMKSYDE